MTDGSNNSMLTLAFRRWTTLIPAAHFEKANRRLSADHRPSFVECPCGVREIDRPTGFPIGLKLFLDEIDEVRGRARVGLRLITPKRVICSEGGTAVVSSS